MVTPAFFTVAAEFFSGAIEERDKINTEVIDAIDQTALSWGVKVLRYEIKDITPPVAVKEAMEAQMTAERQKRANIATIMPSNVADVAGLIATAMSTVREIK
ncbi:MAG: hypothetical protein EHM37_14815 [Deltaproteobacteria bacterium]|nr:MAG: hypothetical protein EHM37_21730 [Deltaproteobacteria bacterium]RPJ10009.1 MAG: hypothetical protein EHM37_14815 [Deltaproteobacteria bacterium]